MAQTVTATDAELLKPINAVFQQTFLRRAQQVCPYFYGTTPGQMQIAQGTSTVKWRRIEQETPSTSALSELTTTSAWMQNRDADTPTYTDVLATLSKYGQFYIVNEEVDLYNPNGTADELVAVLGESAGRSLNMLMRDVMEDNSTQRYASNVASTGAVHAVTVVGDLNRVINELAVNAARPFTALTTGSGNIGTAPFLPSFWAICHPDVAYDVAGLTGFNSVEKYAGQTAIVQGEFGYYSRAGFGCRFIQTPDASQDLGAGALISAVDLVSSQSAKADVFTIVVYGQDAFGSVGLGKRMSDGIYRAGDNMGGFEIINHPRGSGGIGDPFNEIATIAWKAFFAGAVLNSSWSRAIRVAATDLTN
jgi:N4-gp56 family major capsid protein